MEQIKKFLHGKGFALLLTASLLAAAAAGVWAVRALRAELQKKFGGAERPRHHPTDHLGNRTGLGRTGGHHMAAARDRRCKQQDRCAAADALWGILWCAVWLWFAARTFGTARRILACQQFSTACRRALYAGARAQRLQRR